MLRVFSTMQIPFLCHPCCVCITHAVGYSHELGSLRIDLHMQRIISLRFATMSMSSKPTSRSPLLISGKRGGGKAMEMNFKWCNGDHIKYICNQAKVTFILTRFYRGAKHVHYLHREVLLNSY